MMPERKIPPHADDLLDKALQDTFPASDPVTVHATVPDEKEERAKARAREKQAGKKTLGIKGAKKYATRGRKKTRGR